MAAKVLRSESTFWGPLLCREKKQQQEMQQPFSVENNQARGQVHTQVPGIRQHLINTLTDKATERSSRCAVGVVSPIVVPSKTTGVHTLFFCFFFLMECRVAQSGFELLIFLSPH